MNLYKKTFKFKKTKNQDGGSIEAMVPVFDWEEFKKLPEAFQKAFVEKHFYSALQKIVGDAHNNKNGTSLFDYSSFESLIIRDLRPSKKDIEAWLNSRPWETVTFKSEPTHALLNEIKDYLISLADLNFPLREKVDDKLATEVIAQLSDGSFISEFLYKRLTTPNKYDELLKSL